MELPLPLTRDVLLIGGGHTHALVLRAWGMKPLPGVRLTVVNPGPTAPYSGMLPGHIAGHYGRDDLEIDLVRLARFAGARLIADKVVDIDPEGRRATTAGGRQIAYDVASVDVGITAEMPNMPGFEEHAVGAKPLDVFAQRWRDFLQSVDQPVQTAVIGGGVAGSEVAMAMSHALNKRAPGSSVVVIEAADDITGMSPSARARIRTAMADLNVEVMAGATIERVDADAVLLKDGRSIPSKLTVGAAGARPWDWIQSLGLPLQDGFIRVRPDLRVVGVDTLFAVGDCAHMDHAPRPKAGVFAVRAAPVLLHNLRSHVTGAPLKVFKPQKHYLKLVSLGGKVALAEKFGFSIASAGLWRWKDRIDRTFMNRFARLPSMPRRPLPHPVAQGVKAQVQGQAPICGGCGSKLGESVLQAAVASLPKTARADVLSVPGDDAAVLAGPDMQQQVLTTDQLRGFTLDPHLQAEITAIHALGDIWAMGAKPQAVLANITLPPMSEALQRRTMAEVMKIAGAVIAREGASIVGGHSTTGAELSIGFTVTGLMRTDAITHAGAQPGDALVLTRPIGSGTLLAAEMAQKARGADLLAMLSIMRQPQGMVADVLHKAHAMTDVTGFGLAGHLMRLCRESGVAADLWWSEVPIYRGAAEMAAAGVRSSLYPANAAASPVIGADPTTHCLMHDPQTAGGLLAAVDVGAVDHVLQQLRALGHPAHQIGVFREGEPAIRLATP